MYKRGRVKRTHDFEVEVLCSSVNFSHPLCLLTLFINPYAQDIEKLVKENLWWQTGSPRSGKPLFRRERLTGSGRTTHSEYRVKP